MPSCREECREVFVALIGREEFTSVRVCGVRSEEFTPRSRTRRELNFITRSRIARGVQLHDHGTRALGRERTCHVEVAASIIDGSHAVGLTSR